MLTAGAGSAPVVESQSNRMSGFPGFSKASGSSRRSIPHSSSLLLPLLLLLLLAGCRPEEDEPIIEPPTPTPSADSLGYFAYGLAAIDIVTDGEVEVDSKDPADYRPCTVTVDGGGVFADFEGRAQIRGRGNSTWLWYPKKPYRIKFDESVPMLGMETNRDWVLLADYRDVTHMMNNVGFTLAHVLGIPYTNHSRYATVTLNGEDLGLYMVTEQVERGGNRVDIDRSGGLLLALDINDGPADEPLATNNFYSEVIRMAVAVKNPANPNDVQLDYARSEFAKLEHAIVELDYDKVSSLMDVSSMVDYLIVQEAIANVELDNNPSARSVYINRDLNGKWTMGPVWDCDGGFSYNWGDMYDSWGWGHTYFESYRTLILGSQPFTGRDAYGAGPSPFFSFMFGMPEFVKAFKQRWAEKRDEMLETVVANIDATYDVIATSMRADCMLWGISNYNPAEEVSKLRRWLNDRFDYLDAVIAAYDENPTGGGSPLPADEVEIVDTVTLTASYPQDGHHFGTRLYPSSDDCSVISKALGIEVSQIPSLLAEGALRLAHNSGGTLLWDTNASDAEGIGFWFDSQANVSPYGNDSSVYVELSYYEFCFVLGKHPTQCAPGRYEVNIVLAYGSRAVQVDLTITITPAS